MTTHQKGPGLGARHTGGTRPPTDVSKKAGAPATARTLARAAPPFSKLWPILLARSAPLYLYQLSSRRMSAHFGMYSGHNIV